MGLKEDIADCRFLIADWISPIPVDRSFASKVDFGGNEFRVLVRMTSWIVPSAQKNKDDPRSHTKQHEPKSFRIKNDKLKRIGHPLTVTNLN